MLYNNSHVIFKTKSINVAYEANLILCFLPVRSTKQRAICERCGALKMFKMKKFLFLNIKPYMLQIFN